MAEIVSSTVEGMDILPSPYHTVALSSKTSTRLLTLHCGSGDDAILCSLATIDLETNPRYEALSYCWGTPDNPQSVILGGLLVEVRENLWQALWHLRLPEKDRVLWVDALCINQEDGLERNHQVSLMSRIYSEAKYVLAWLGPATETSDIALDYILDFSLRFLNHASESKRRIQEIDHKALSDLCNHEYWQRMWILQEFGLATHLKIHCGGKSISGSQLEACYSEKPPHIEFNPVTALLGPVASLLKYRKSRRNYDITVKQQETTLIALLSAFNTRKCADPKDSVFALVGMASDCSGSNPRMSFTADYSVSLFGTYMNLCKIVIEGEKAESTSGLTPVRTYNQILRFYLQCCTATCPEASRRFKPPWKLKKSWERFEEMESRNDESIHRRARDSLRDFHAESGFEEVLKWLETPSCSEDAKIAEHDEIINRSVENAPRWPHRAENFRQWALEFPSEIRQMAKLQLFVAVYMRQSKLKIDFVGNSTEVTVSLHKNWVTQNKVIATVVVDNETSDFNVLRQPEEVQKSEYFYLVQWNKEFQMSRIL